MGNGTIHSAVDYFVCVTLCPWIPDSSPEWDAEKQHWWFLYSDFRYICISEFLDFWIVQLVRVLLCQVFEWWLPVQCILYCAVHCVVHFYVHCFVNCVVQCSWLWTVHCVYCTVQVQAQGTPRRYDRIAGAWREPLYRCVVYTVQSIVLFIESAHWADSI